MFNSCVRRASLQLWGMQGVVGKRISDCTAIMGVQVCYWYLFGQLVVRCILSAQGGASRFSVLFDLTGILCKDTASLLDCLLLSCLLLLLMLLLVSLLLPCG